MPQPNVVMRRAPVPPAPPPGKRPSLEELRAGQARFAAQRGMTTPTPAPARQAATAPPAPFGTTRLPLGFNPGEAFAGTLPQPVPARRTVGAPSRRPGEQAPMTAGPTTTPAMARRGEQAPMAAGPTATPATGGPSAAELAARNPAQPIAPGAAPAGAAPAEQAKEGLLPSGMERGSWMELGFGSDDEGERWANQFAAEHGGTLPWDAGTMSAAENLKEHVGALRWGQEKVAGGGTAPTPDEYRWQWYVNRFGLGSNRNIAGASPGGGMGWMPWWPGSWLERKLRNPGGKQSFPGSKRKWKSQKGALKAPIPGGA